MNLNLYDQDLNRIAIIGNRFVSCLWSEGYNTVQPFTLELQETDEYRKKVRPECYVGRDDRKTLMVLKTVKYEGGKIVATGAQAARVLDDVAFIGTIQSGSEIDTEIIAAYESSTRYHNVAFADSALGVTCGSQISNKSILTLCKTMCQSGDVGFRAVREGGQVQVQFYKPVQNPNLVYSESFGNLLIKAITLSTENMKNYAIVLGAGEGESRVRVDVDLTGGDDRRELIVDARDLQMEDGETAAAYRERLYARGIEQLLTRKRTWKCDCTPIAKDFGQRFDLGDILTVLLPVHGLRLETRVAKFTQKEQNNKTTTTIEVGEITITR